MAGVVAGQLVAGSVPEPVEQAVMFLVIGVCSYPVARESAGQSLTLGRYLLALAFGSLTGLATSMVLGRFLG